MLPQAALKALSLVFSLKTLAAAAAANHRCRWEDGLLLPTLLVHHAAEAPTSPLGCV